MLPDLAPRERLGRWSGWGWGLGYVFAYVMTEGFRTELYRVPLVVNRNVYAWASLIVFAATAISGLIVRRRVDRLDMIEVLKTRE